MTSARSFRLAALAATIAAGLATPAFAADTQNLSVTASVPGICKFTSTPAMSFTLDPSSGAVGTASSAIAYKCTKGTTGGTFTVGGVSVGSTGFTSAAGTGVGTDLAGATAGNLDTIRYSINWSAPAAFTGNGFGTGSTANTVTLNGTIPYNNYANVAADTYSGTVAITINP